MRASAAPSAHVTNHRLAVIREQALRAWRRESRLGNRDELARVLAQEAEATREVVLRDLPDDMAAGIAKVYEQNRFTAQERADMVRDLPRAVARRLVALHLVNRDFALEIARQVRGLPQGIGLELVGLYQRNHDLAQNIADKLKTCSAVGLSLDAGEHEVRELAERRAREFYDLIKMGDDRFELACTWATERGAQVPEVDPKGEGVTKDGVIKRLQSPAYWRKQLHREHFRSVEAQHILLGRVCTRRAPYVSDEAVALHRNHKRKSMNMLQQAFAINEQEEQFSMFELWKIGVSNPEVRRAELMVRIKGTETIARDVGHVGMFLTINAPSKYHPCPKTHHGKINPKWLAAGQPTPRDASDYFCEKWALSRTALNNAGITFYGLRIAEPHGDSCPHWHALFFCPPEQVDEFLEIVGDYFCQEDADEIEHNLQARFKAVTIDWSRGSAAGYCAKYVCKNIDGRKADGKALEALSDESGLDFVSSAERVQAWAALWGIRQFQFIGGPPVGVWRELRRLKADKAGEHSVNAQIDAAAKAADDSNWAEFCRLNGGMFTRRRYRPVQLMKVEATKPNRYGEEGGPAVKGVEYRDATALKAEEEARKQADRAERRALRADKKIAEHLAKGVGEYGYRYDRRQARIADWRRRKLVATRQRLSAMEAERAAIVNALHWHEITRSHEWVIDWHGKAEPDPNKQAQRAEIRRH